MRAADLFRAGKLDEAIEALGSELRADPTDSRRRTFLFELLCFAGQFDRAEKQLDVLARAGPEAEAGTLLYRSALHAERTRHDRFLEALESSGAPTAPVAGTLNGVPFHSLMDADPRVGGRLEVFAGGQYIWMPFEHIASIRMDPPKRVRDLLWAPATIRAGPGFHDMELGEVLLPVLAPFSWNDENERVRLGQVTEWREVEGGIQVPVGQKMLLVDDEEFPLLEVREMEVVPVPATAS
jgi:type VI secretion system protein ImpE